MRSGLAWMALAGAVVALGACGASSADTAAEDAPSASTGGSSAAVAGSGGMTSAGTGGLADKAGSGGAAAGASTGTGGSGLNTAAEPFSAYGHFDVELSGVTANIPMGPSQGMPPSQGVKFRFDIPAPPPSPSTAAWVATVTPRWGAPSSFMVSMANGALTLTGSASVDSAAGQPMASDVWQSFTVSLSADSTSAVAMATGVVTGSGQETVYGNDVGSTGSLTATGTFGPDVTAPAAQPSTLLRFGPNDAILPWEPVSATFAEPLDPSEVAAHLSVVDGMGNVVDFGAFSPSMDAPDGQASYLLAWSNTPATASLRLTDGYLDPSGNAGMGFDLGLAVVSVPKGAALSKTFGGVVDYASWGGSLVASMPAATSDAGCTGGACLVVGPFENDFCGVARAGIAGRLTIPASAISPSGKKLAGEVHLRARVYFQPTSDAPNAAPYVTGLAPMAVALARPGQAPVVTDIAMLPAAADLGDAAGAFRFATPWTDVTLPVPASSAGLGGEIGFAVHAGGENAVGACSDSASMPVQTKIVLDTIGVE